MAQQDDELVSGFETGEALSDEEIAKREAAFQKKVKARIATLRSPKKFTASQRAEAARWLGETGEPTAIEHLVLVYEKDSHAEVRAACAQALAMYKAFGAAYLSQDPEISAYAQSLAEDIILHGRIGKPSRFKPRTLRFVLMGLTASALVLFMLAFARVSAPQPPTEAELTGTFIAENPPTATPTEITLASAQSELATLFNQLEANAQTLEGEYRNIIAGQVPNCSVTLYDVPEYRLPDLLGGSNFTSLRLVPDQFNQVRATIAAVREQFSGICAGTSVLSVADAQAALDSQLLPARNQLVAISSLMSSSQVQLTPSITPSPTVTPTPTLTPIPTATPDMRIVEQQQIAFESTIEEMIGVRGLLTLLASYWGEAQTTGTSSGCLQLPLPSVPTDVSVRADVQAIAPQGLFDAASTINVALAQARRSVAAFESSCRAGTLLDSSRIELQNVSAAITAFESARTTLETMLGTPAP